MAAIDIITLSDAKLHLNISGTTYDTELGFFVSAASRLWVNRVGPVNQGVQTFDEWYDGGTQVIALRNIPVGTITSVQESLGAVTYTLTNQTLLTGGDVSAWGYSIELNTGQLTRRAAGVATAFQGGIRNVRVVYTAGYSTAPEDIQLAVRMLVAHMWETQRGGAKRPGAGGEEWTPQMGFVWPNRVEEIAQNYRVPGIA